MAAFGLLLGLTGGIPAAPPDSRYVVQARSLEVDLPALARDHRLQVVRTLPAIRAAVLTGPAGRLAALERDPRLASAGLDQPCRTAGDGGGCCNPAPLQLTDAELRRERDRLDAAFGAVRARASGRGVVVAVLDTGLQGGLRPLEGAVVPGTSLLPGVPWDEDVCGHGTAMAALVVARPGQAAPEGLATGAQVLPIRVADRTGRAWAADVSAGIVQAVDRGAKVVLLALGSRLPTPVLDQALTYAETRGVLVVAAAGNRNVHQDLFPAADPRVLAVGATSDRGELAWSTALAPTTDLLAPGEKALTLLPRGMGSVSGTSVAAARVAGLAALLLELRPDLDPAALRSLLTGARRPVLLGQGSLSEADLARAFPAGSIDAAALLAELDTPRATPALLELRALPAAARPGDPLRLLVRVRNAGVRATAPAQVDLRLGRIPVPALAPGEERELALDVAAPAAGQLVATLGGQTKSATLAAATTQGRDLAFSRLSATPTAAGGLSLEVELEGRGAVALGAAMEGRLGDISLGPFEVPPLGPGVRHVVRAEIAPDAMAELPARPIECFLSMETGDDEPLNDAVGLDVLPPAGNEGQSLATQYQQNGELNIIADAPFRVEPGRPHLPLLLFVPEKGDLDSSTWVRLTRTTLTTRQVADRAAPGTVIYSDRDGGPTSAAPGTVLIDELGQPVRSAGAPDLRLFRHERIDLPGRYSIVRVPRDALSVLSVPTQDEVRFITAEVDWTNERRFLYLFSRTRTGTYRKTLRVSFAAAPRPHLAGMEGQYFDAHLHTYAEWYQNDGFDPIAPRRNLGGPIPMVMESAHALGLTDAIDAAKDRVITTDHGAFYTPGDELRLRPPFGPTAAANSAGKNEHERMGELFGITRGEELAFSASQNLFSWLPVPMGAHVLSYRAQHVEGPWHGGSALARTLGDNAPDLPLSKLIGDLARGNRAENRNAALFAAHPYEGIEWKPEHYALAFEADPATRQDFPVNAEQDGFVTKGLQLWNGREPRRLDPALIDFMDVNPWADAAYAAGSGAWDGELQKGLGDWHRLLSRLLEYELAARPGVRFPRKVLISGGNDAHGDFNYTESREATIVTSQSSLKIHSRAFGDVLTYALGAEQDATNPAERALEALLDGNAVLTDGPLAWFALDAEDRFDQTALRWRELQPRFAEKDGRIGGGGVFDGRGTALVRRGATGVRLRYRWESTREFGDLTRFILHKTAAGDPNPLGQRQGSGGPLLVARGSLASGAEGTDLEERLDPAEEGLVNAPAAIQLAAWTGDPQAPAPDDRRCITNPIWAIPFDPTVVVDRTETDANGKGSIPAGALHVTIEVDASLTPADYRFELKALDAVGDSSDGSIGPIDELLPMWSTSARGVVQGRIELVNQRPIPLDLDRFGAGPDAVTFVVYSQDPVKDAFGNALHRLAFTFEQAGIGTGGGTGPAIPRSGSTGGGTTPAPPPPVVAMGGGGGGGGCALAARPGSSHIEALLLALVCLGLAARRGF